MVTPDANKIGIARKTISKQRPEASIAKLPEQRLHSNNEQIARLGEAGFCIVDEGVMNWLRGEDLNL